MSDLSTSIAVAEIEVVLAAKLWRAAVASRRLIVVDQRAEQLASAVDNLLALEEKDVSF